MSRRRFLVGEQLRVVDDGQAAVYTDARQQIDPAVEVDLRKREVKMNTVI